MSYTHTILNASSVESLVKYVCEGRKGVDDDFIEYFSRAQTYDDVKIVVLSKHLFELLDRIQKERTSTTSENLFQLVTELENYCLCNDIQCFDESFITYIVSKKYADYSGAESSLSIVLVELMKEYYTDAVTI